MLRIRGRIGDWPVDLSLEMDETDWQRFAAALRTVPGDRPPQASAGSDAAPAPSVAERLWLAAQDLLRQAGRCEGPRLLDELAALAGSAAAAKGLLVRLRHSPQVRIEAHDGTQVFIWSAGAGGG